MVQSKGVAPKFLVVMGVAGCGKSTVAALLAQRLGWPFVEGDALHPQVNVEKMRHGISLDDADRLPWLQAIARTIEAWREAGQSGIVACSALRAAYRRTIEGGGDDVWFVHLAGGHDLIAQRLITRQGHFMPIGLLDSQFATLEPPALPEKAITLDVAVGPEALADAALAALRDVL
ncbi:MAG: carbohydrate kinase [Acidocella sp. 20-63-7]|nr:MAG: carbohydrate kinase [Acidocella sp. 20-63-7]HQT47490.1 gluconokinase [Acidocella sp.]